MMVGAVRRSWSTMKGRWSRQRPLPYRFIRSYRACGGRCPEGGGNTQVVTGGARWSRWKSWRKNICRGCEIGL